MAFLKNLFSKDEPPHLLEKKFDAYIEAEQKIEETLQSGATELDLGGMQLTELPESLGQLTQLRVLYLDRNRLAGLPKFMANLKQFVLVRDWLYIF